MVNSQSHAAGVPAGRNDPEGASPSLEQLGYKQELKRSLSLFDLVVYGLVIISPATFGLFGIVFNKSAGMVPLVYLVGFVPMLFTAMGYAFLSREFPVAGSVYSYAGRTIGQSAGFIAGWLMLLDYALIPTLVYVVAAIQIHAVLPDIPPWLAVAVPLIFCTCINLLGIETTARTNGIFLALNLTILAIFLVAGVLALGNGTAGAHLSIQPFWNAELVSPSLIFSALSFGMLAYLGFDAISTLAEESKGKSLWLGKATLITLFILVPLFVIQNYLACLFVLDRSSFPNGVAPDGAFYDIAGTIAGPWLKFLTSVGNLVVVGVPMAMAAQVATARLLFSMARDGKLPRVLASVHARRKVPDRAILLVATVTLVLSLTLVGHLELLASLLSFGALSGFLLLHLSVVVHFMWRNQSKDWLRHLVVPLLGFTIIACALVNAATNAKIVGLAWLAVGGVVLVGLKLKGKQATLRV